MMEEERPEWRVNINSLLERKINEDNVARSLKSFYRKQNRLIDSFAEADKILLHGADTNQAQAEKDRRAVAFAINASFAGNCALLIAKVVAAVLSGSLGIIASAIDSSLDIISGSIIFLAAHVAKKNNKAKYPIGRTRLEPLSIIVFASVMAMAALQLLREATEVIFDGLTLVVPVVHIDSLVLSILGCVVFVKLVLMVICYGLRHKSTSVDALYVDHRNDVLTNSATIAAVIVASNFSFFWYLDPLAAIGLAFMIFATWVATGLTYTRQITGQAATPQLLSQLTYLAMNHDPRIQYIDTVRAYHVGHKLLAELDIVLPPQMSLKEAHDIGESLQQEIETLPDVERAYVHLDYEFSHDPNREHHDPQK